ncbi:hypothetical protein BaRGS_00016837, partial [Batillaria attramentaria]
ERQFSCEAFHHTGGTPEYGRSRREKKTAPLNNPSEVEQAVSTGSCIRKQSWGT